MVPASRSILAERNCAADLQHLHSSIDVLHSADVARILLWICSDRCPTKESSFSGTLRQSRHVDGFANERSSSSDKHPLDHGHCFSDFCSLLVSESYLVHCPVQRPKQLYILQSFVVHSLLEHLYQPFHLRGKTLPSEEETTRLDFKKFSSCSHYSLAMVVCLALLSCSFN